MPKFILKLQQEILHKSATISNTTVTKTRNHYQCMWSSKLRIKIFELQRRLPVTILLLSRPPIKYVDGSYHKGSYMHINKVKFCFSLSL